MRVSMHVSAISTFRLSLADDIAFWAEHGIGTVGVSVAKLEAGGWDAGTALVADAVARGLRVADLIRPFHFLRIHIAKHNQPASAAATAVHG